VSDSGKRLAAVFFRTPSGTEPVRDWLKSLPKEDRLTIGSDLKTVEFGWPVGMPICRSLGGGLWEMRSRLPRGRTARVLFFVHDGQIVLLHGFMKTTQKTPPADMRLALERKREVERGEQ
jgi:phage-related protein